MITEQKQKEIDEIVEDVDRVSDLIVARWERVKEQPREDHARDFGIDCSYLRRVVCKLERLSDELLQEVKKK